MELEIKTKYEILWNYDPKKSTEKWREEKWVSVESLRKLFNRIGGNETSETIKEFLLKELGDKLNGEQK
jgi:hypothetical protein